MAYIPTAELNGCESFAFGFRSTQRVENAAKRQFLAVELQSTRARVAGQTSWRCITANYTEV